MQDLLLDRLVWFLRNVDLTQGLAAIVAHYRDGIAAVEAALDDALPEPAAAARRAREAELSKGGVPAELARRIAMLPVLAAAPDIVLVADRTGQNIADGRGDLFRGRGVLPPRSHRQRRRAASWSRIISTGWRSTARSIRSATPSGG